MTSISSTNAGPSFAFFNKVDGGWAYIGYDRQRICWNAKTQRFANVHYLFLGQFVIGLVFASQVNKPCFPFMFGIFCQRNPLKVFRSVVRLDAIDVIDGKVRFVPMHKTHCNQAMNKNFWSFAVLQGGNHQVPISIQKRRKFDRWKIAGKSLLNTISGAFCCAGSSLIPYASVLIHKPRNAFFNNFDWVHNVNIIAGHWYKCKPA